jgi:hypothetical protein
MAFASPEKKPKREETYVTESFGSLKKVDSRVASGKNNNTCMYNKSIYNKGEELL